MQALKIERTLIILQFLETLFLNGQTHQSYYESRLPEVVFKVSEKLL